MAKVTNTHSEYVIALVHGNSGYVNASECCFIRALPVMFSNKGSADVVSVTDTPCELLILFIIWEAKWTLQTFLPVTSPLVGFEHSKGVLQHWPKYL